MHVRGIIDIDGGGIGKNTGQQQSENWIYAWILAPAGANRAD
jgi:hypothetical protein